MLGSFHATDNRFFRGLLHCVGPVAPFAALLLCIAVVPLAAPHLWEMNRVKALVSLALSARAGLDGCRRVSRY
jgi:hypothetical protein